MNDTTFAQTVKNMTYRDWKYCIIASVCVVGQYILPSLLHTVILLIGVAFSLKSTNFVFNKRIMFLIMPFVFLLPIGLISAWQWDMKDIFRDWWYVINPLFVLLAGGCFSEKIQGDLSIILKSILVAATAFSLVHFYQIYVHLPELDSVFELHNAYGTSLRTGSVLTALAISILLYSEVSRFIEWRVGTKVIILLLCAISLALSLSRSWLMSLVILTIVFSLLKVRKRKSILVFSALTAVVIILFFLLFPMSDQAVSVCEGGFFCKILASVHEITPRYYLFIPDLKTYWRGYESYMAMQQYKDGNTFQLFFGQGLGVLIELNISLVLGAATYSKIPILHNGYMYALLKFGLAGLFIYVAQCMRFLILGLNAFVDDEYEQRLIGAFVISSSAMIMLLTFVNAGFFNKNSMIPVLFFMAALIRSRFYTIDKAIKAQANRDVKLRR